RDVPAGRRRLRRAGGGARGVALARARALLLGTGRVVARGLPHRLPHRVPAPRAAQRRCRFDLAADAAVNYREGDFVAAAAQATGGRGVDVVLDSIGAPYLDRNL